MSIFVSQNELRKYVTGPTVVSNILINPTLEELHAWGVDWIKNEPEYIREYNGNKVLNIHIYAKAVQDPDIIIDWKIGIMDKLAAGKNDPTRFQYVNAKGQSINKKESDPFPAWFDSTGARKAYVGEALLYQFIIAFNNIRPRQQDVPSVLLPDIPKLFTGDFAQLKEANSLTTNKLKIIVGLTENDGKVYHQVDYQHYFHFWATEAYHRDLGNQRVDFGDFIKYIVTEDQYCKFNPDFVTGYCNILTMDVAKEALRIGKHKFSEDEEATEMENVSTNSSDSADDLPF